VGGFLLLAEDGSDLVFLEAAGVCPSLVRFSPALVSLTFFL